MVSAVSYCMIWCFALTGARQSTFLSLDIKTFDNRARTDAEEEEEEEGRKEKPTAALCLLIMLPEMSLCRRNKLHDISQ